MQVGDLFNLFVLKSGKINSSAVLSGFEMCLGFLEDIMLALS